MMETSASTTPTVEVVGPTKRALRFEVPASAVGAAFRTAVTDLAAVVRLPGFRPGKAPAQVVERQFRSEVHSRALDLIIKRHADAAVAAAGLRPLGRVEIEVRSLVDKGSPLTLAAHFEVMPAIDLSGSVGAELTYTAIAPDDGDIDAEIAKVRQGRAELAPVDGPVDDMDAVTISFTVTEPGAGEPFRKATRLETDFDGSSLPLAVLQAFAGAAVGAQVATTVRLADDSEFHVEGELHEIVRKVLPEVDDELGRDQGFADLASWRADIAVRLQAEADQIVADEKAAAALHHAARTIAIPEALIDTVAGRFLGEDAESAHPLQRAVTRGLARTTLGQSLALEAVIAQHAITASDDEVERALASHKTDALQRNKHRRDEVERHFAGPEARSRAATDARASKARSRLVDLAVWTCEDTVTLRQWHDKARPRAPASSTGPAAADDANPDAAGSGAVAV